MLLLSPISSTGRTTLVFRITLALALVGFLSAVGLAQTPAPQPNLPKVVLIGDSIRLGYAPLVAKQLEGKAIIVSPSANGGDSANVLKNLEAWADKEKPDLIHLNCGLHDLKFDKKTMKHQVPLEDYRTNLEQIVARIRKATSAKLIFASTTPILDDRHAKRGANFDRFEADVKKYNVVAQEVMRKANVPVNDLHAVVVDGDAEKLLGKDGTHYTPEGYQRLAAVVAERILRELAAKPVAP